MPEPFTAVCSSLPVCSSLTRVPATLFVVLAVTGCLAALLSGCPSFCFYCLRWCLLSSVLLLPPTPLFSNCIPCFAVLLRVQVEVPCRRAVRCVCCEALRSRRDDVNTHKVSLTLYTAQCASASIAVGGCEVCGASGCGRRLVSCCSGATRCPGISSSLQSVTAPAGRLSERANTTQEHINEAAI